ncbi:MAG: hypothetical protein LBH78_02660 [Rickettsiales bacterium]|nr:hypothetical protein [Rickettsiales bacterium]
MLKCTIFMENWIPVSSTGMTRKGYWNDKKRATWMTS